MKRLINSGKQLGMATLCFLIGVASFHLYSGRLSEGPESIVTRVSDERVTQQWSRDTDSSRFPDSILVELQDSVSRTMPGYKFGRAFCTCPGIISGQVSYSYGSLARGSDFVADVYIAESSSKRAAETWIEDWQKAGAERVLKAPNLEGVRSQKRDSRYPMILIRSDKFVVQISGEASAVEALAKGIIRSRRPANHLLQRSAG